MGKIQRLNLRLTGVDRWVWSRGSYSVKEAYDSIMEGGVTEEQRKLAAAWNGLVPLKVAVLVWRLFQNRIPSKDNLCRRGVLAESQSGCVNGCGVVETASHLIFECPASIELWQKILLWLNHSSALHNNALQNLNQFAGLAGWSRVHVARISVIWFACVWILWNRRNEMIFSNLTSSAADWIEEVKSLSWKWTKAKAVGFNYSLSEWILNPLACL